MTDRIEDLLAGVDEPRPLPPALRARLEAELRSAADGQMRLGDELRDRLHEELTVAAASRRRRAGALLGAAAAVVATALALAATLTGGHDTGRTPHAAGLPPAVGGSPDVVPTSAEAGAARDAGPVATVRSTPASSAARGSAGVARAAATAPGGATTGGRATAANGSVSPAAGPVGGGTTVTLHGRGLAATVAVVFGAARASSYRVVSDTTVTAVTPPATPGTVDVAVRLASGRSDRLGTFSYLPRPDVTAVSPTTGPAAGGTWVAVSGNALGRTSTVRFGDVLATRVVVVSDGEVRALSPRHLPGIVDVTVTTPGGTSAAGADDRYTYLP